MLYKQHKCILHSQAMLKDSSATQLHAIELCDSITSAAIAMIFCNLHIFIICLDARVHAAHTHKLFWFRRTLRTNSFLAIVYVCTMGDMMPWREHASEFRHSSSDDDDKHVTFSLWLRFLIVLDLVSFLFPVEHWLRIHCGSA